MSKFTKDINWLYESKTQCVALRVLAYAGMAFCVLGMTAVMVGLIWLIIWPRTPPVVDIILTPLTLILGAVFVFLGSLLWEELKP